MNVKISGLVLVLLLAGVSMGQQKKQAEIDLQAAIRTENIKGLKAAIKEYETIVSKYGKTDRATAAMALIRLGNAHQSLGDLESRSIYDRVVKDYADQKDAVALARARLSGSNSSTAMNSVLVWSASTRALWNVGTVSPDGRYVSSAGILPKVTGVLAIHEFATGMDRNITENGAATGKPLGHAGQSAISKDGKRIAYEWCDDKKCEIQVANLTEPANPQHLYDNPDTTHIVPVDWAPNGESVAVQIERKDGTNQIGLVLVRESRLQVLKSVDWRGAGRMFFSPDGQWLGFDLPRDSVNPERDVFVLSVNGSREIHAVDHPAEDEMAGWSHDGKWLLFFSRRTSSRDLWALPFTAESQGTPQLVTAGFEGSTPLGVTTSGDFYYTKETGGGSSRIQIASADVAAGKLSAPIELSQSYGNSSRNPEWSPDGKSLAYITLRGRPERVHIVIHSLETGRDQELQPNLSYFRLESWHPGGRFLLVQGTNSTGQSAFYLVDIETSDLKVLGPGLDINNNKIKWAPDGRSFLVETKGSKPALYRIDVETGEAFEVMPFPPGQSTLPGLYPVWSADGKSIYYRRVFGSSDALAGDEAIIERNLSSGAERELARRPRWILSGLTADGQNIVAVSLDNTSRTLLLIPIQGGATRELLRVPSKVGLSSSMPASDSNSLLVFKDIADANTVDQSIVHFHTELWLVPLRGGEPKKVGDVPTQLTSASPDKRYLAYTVADTGSERITEIRRLQNFLPKATKK